MPSGKRFIRFDRTLFKKDYFCNLIVVVPCKSFQPSLLFASKAGAYLVEAPLSFYTLLHATVLTHKHWSRLDRLAKDKRSSLLLKFENYGRKKFYKIGP
jgi:hypothetical protein